VRCCSTSQAKLPDASTSVANRLQWMVNRAAPFSMPVGEAVDGTAKTFVMVSCPDLYEDGGVYVWTVLIHQGLAWLPDPTTWPSSPAV